MLNCLENIVSIRGCDYEASLSGLDLMDAPEISPINLANVANEKDTSGFALAQRIRSNAGVQVRNDLLTVLSQNQMLVDVTNRKYESGEFVPTKTLVANSTEKGVVFNRADKHKFRTSIKKSIIHYIRIFPLEDVSDVNIYIRDSGILQPTITTYTQDLVGGEINNFLVDYEVQGQQAVVSIADSRVTLVSNKIICYEGCHGSLPNNCGYIKSYYGQSISGYEGYGIGIQFSCECDYDRIICFLAKTTLGKLIWMKARIMLMMERLSGNRLNNWIVYGNEEMQNYYLPKLESEYQNTWNTFVKSLPSILKQHNGDCIICNGVRSVISV